MRVAQLKQYFYKGRAQAFAWPGGYPLFYLCSDGGTLCPKCITKQRAQVFRSTHERARDGWAVAGVSANWEDTNLFCDHCGERIESAYADPTEVSN